MAKMKMIFLGKEVVLHQFENKVAEQVERLCVALRAQYGKFVESYNDKSNLTFEIAENIRQIFRSLRNLGAITPDETRIIFRKLDNQMSEFFTGEIRESVGVAQ
ncbi:MAG: hypothetical protein RR416_03105 [Clostridia bacterium]